ISITQSAGEPRYGANSRDRVPKNKSVLDRVSATLFTAPARAARPPAGPGPRRTRGAAARSRTRRAGAPPPVPTGPRGPARGPGPRPAPGRLAPPRGSEPNPAGHRAGPSRGGSTPRPFQAIEAEADGPHRPLVGERAVGHLAIDGREVASQAGHAEPQLGDDGGQGVRLGLVGEPPAAVPGRRCARARSRRPGVPSAIPRPRT